MYTKPVTTMNGNSRMGFVAHSFSIPKGKMLIVTRDGAMLMNRDELKFTGLSLRKIELR